MIWRCGCQIVCLQLDDPVQFRYHWPINCKLAVNGKSFRVYARHADNKVTVGQRDEPADISAAESRFCG